MFLVVMFLVELRLHPYFLPQVWAEHFKVIDQGFPVPNDYKNLPFSMTYGEDVGQAVVKVLNTGITNQVRNIYTLLLSSRQFEV